MQAGCKYSARVTLKSPNHPILWVIDKWRRSISIGRAHSFTISIFSPFQRQILPFSMIFISDSSRAAISCSSSSSSITSPCSLHYSSEVTESVSTSTPCHPSTFVWPAVITSHQSVCITLSNPSVFQSWRRLTSGKCNLNQSARLSPSLFDLTLPTFSSSIPLRQGVPGQFNLCS